MDMTTLCSVAIVAIKTAAQSLYNVELHVTVNSVQVAAVAIDTQ
jgi:hypothetical protein